MKNLIVLLLISFKLAGCTGLRTPLVDYGQVGSLTDKDYVDHLQSLGPAYLNFNADKNIKISDSAQKYLIEIYERVIKNNEIFLPKRESPSFYLIQNATPFIFSLPGSQFFVSSGLVKRFLKNEQMFVAALVREIIRSQRNLYEKNLVVMTGNISTEKMFHLQKLSPEIKNSLNEWSFVVLRRTGFDASALLAWIQLQNKNPLDFALYSGEKGAVSREEFAFKNYLVRSRKVNMELAFSDEKNSSKQFYKLLSEIRED